MFGESDKATAAAALLGLFATSTGYPIFAYCGGHGGGMGGHCGGMGCHGGAYFGRSSGSGGHGNWYSQTKDKHDDQAELYTKLTKKAEQLIAEHKYAKAAKYYAQAIARSDGEQQKSVERSLADCYMQLAAAQEQRPAEQIGLFHQALYYEYEDANGQEGLRKAIRAIGRNPDTFEDRLGMGDKAKAGGDAYGAVIEYIEALQIKDDPSVRSKLDELKTKYRRR